MVAENTSYGNGPVALQPRLDDLAPQIGNTPLVPIRQVFQKEGVTIYAKQEWMQLSGSVKARPAAAIVRAALAEGHLEGRHLLDASGGNMSLAYAAIGAAIGLPVTICLPENASQKRRLMLRSYGAELIYAARAGGATSLRRTLDALRQERPDQYYYPDHARSEHNWRAHYEQTAPEIWEQTAGKVTHFVAGLGTAGTFVGVGRKLRELNPAVRLVGLQPQTSIHSLEGWRHYDTLGVAPLYDPTLADEVLTIDTYKAFDLIRRVAQTEGMLISPSSAANLLGAMAIAQQIDTGTIVTVFSDSAEKYGRVLRSLYPEN